MIRYIQADHAQAEEILSSIYDRERNAVYVDADRLCVNGSVVRAQFAPSINVVTITSNAISTDAGLMEYLPAWVELLDDAALAQQGE